MTRTKTGAILAVLTASAAYAQGTDAKPQFDVATIKPSAPPMGGMIRIGPPSGGPGTKDPGRYTASFMSLSNLIMQAYDIKRYQLTGPSFLDTERFDVTAKVPEGATKEQFRLMLQSLLEERFKMVVHKDKKEMPVYELVQAKGGHKLKETVEDPTPKESGPDAGGPPPLPPNPQQLQMGKDGFPVLPKPTAGRGPMMVMMNGKARMQSSGTTIDQVVNMLSNQIGKPVTDSTGLKGKYDISLYFSPDGLTGGPGGVRMAMAGGPPPGHGDGVAVGGGGAPGGSLPESEAGPNLFSAVQEQLGLKLEQKKGQIDLVVVDKMEKVPTEN